MSDDDGDSQPLSFSVPVRCCSPLSLAHRQASAVKPIGLVSATLILFVSFSPPAPFPPRGRTCRQFKEAVSKKFNAQADQLCLIFAGKIMKDHETLGMHNIKDGLAVHLVIKAPRTATTQNQESNSASRPQGIPPGLYLSKQ